MSTCRLGTPEKYQASNQLYCWLDMVLYYFDQTQLSCIDIQIKIGWAQRSNTYNINIDVRLLFTPEDQLIVRWMHFRVTRYIHTCAMFHCNTVCI